jgi:ABC-2 type transport system ATP-binding protein
MGERKAIIFSTHILEEVEAVCSRAIIIDRGQIVANGTPQQLKAKSEMAGTVLLIARGVAGHQVVERLSGLPDARKTTIVKEEKGKVWARVYPKSPNQNGELARQVFAASSGWQLEEIRTDEGRLDEVFRSITLPDTTKEAAK